VPLVSAQPKSTPLCCLANAGDEHLVELWHQTFAPRSDAADLSRELGLCQTRVGLEFSLLSLQCLPSEDAERVAGNKMALNVERILDDGLNRQEPLHSGRFETLHLPLASSHRQMRILGPIVSPQALLMTALSE